jgi:hypothetical protein
MASDQNINERFDKVKQLIENGDLLQIEEKDLLLAIAYTDQVIKNIYSSIIKLEKQLNFLRNELDYLTKVKEFLINEKNERILSQEIEEEKQEE